ncbi:MAG: PEGA domain-containing protein, partial [Candidatus Levyibacteriota bacterium]
MTMSKQLILGICIFVFLVLITIVVVLYGKGYRFGLDNGRPQVKGTGLLVATSTPDGAQVFIDGHLSTATNNTINLAPGMYDVRITKPGYFDWDKKIRIDAEVVSKAEALL